MPQKLHRGKKRVFRKQRTAVLKNIVLGILGVMVVAGSFFATKYIVEHPRTTAESSSVPSSDASSPSLEQPSSSEPSVSEPEQPAAATHGFYLPVETLRDEAQLDTLLTQAAAAGFNHVVFDLKPVSGELQYVSAVTLAARNTAKDAWTMEQLTALARRMRDKGLEPVPRLFAFQDESAGDLDSAKITYGDSTITWLDAKPENGGKPWLNPCSPDARAYILGLVEELKNNGFQTVMLDSVQFPNKEWGAFYGHDPLSSQPKRTVLETFLQEVRAVEGVTVILSMPGEAAANGAEAFGGNPLTLGAAVAAPALTAEAASYETVKAQVTAAQALLQTQEGTVLEPWLTTADYTAAQVQEQLRAVRESGGDTAGYWLYHAQGVYDFAALQP